MSSSDDGLQDSIERTRQAFRSAPDAPPLIVRRDDSAPLLTAGTPTLPGLHPFFRGLLDALPEPGTVWPQMERDLWLETARHIFALIYSGGEGRVPDRPPASLQNDQLNRQVS